MASHRNKPEFEYDSDDMSAGARLMRYYVSDEPRSVIADPDSSSTAMVEREQSAPTFSGVTNAPSDLRATGSTGKAKRVAKKDTKNESKETQDENDEDDDRNDNAVFRGDLAALRGDVLFNIVGKYSHHDILDKISHFHPQATFGQRQLTWRIANAIKARANRKRVTKLVVRAELDAIRLVNGVEFPHNYRPKNQGNPGGHDGNNNATPSDDEDDGL